MAEWSPRLWRPSARASDVLRESLGRLLGSPEAVGLTNRDAVLLGVRRAGPAGMKVVVEHLESASDEPEVLTAVLQHLKQHPVSEGGTVQVFCPVADGVRLRATEAAGLVAVGRWYVRDLPQALAVAGGRLAEQRPGYSLVPAPPLHDPGGPVAVVSRASSPEDLVAIGADAAARGARVAVVVAGAADEALAAAAADAAYRPLAEVRAAR